MPDGRVEYARARYVTGPIGRWSTAAGTFEVVMQDEWVFLPDFTGTVTTRRALSPPEHRRFEWRERSSFAIDLRMIDAEDCPEPGQEPSWETVRYDFRILRHDAGEELVMHELGATGFYDSELPLRPVGPVDEPAVECA